MSVFGFMPVVQQTVAITFLAETAAGFNAARWPAFPNDILDFIPSRE